MCTFDSVEYGKATCNLNSLVY